jgi:hypothetical protein
MRYEARYDTHTSEFVVAIQYSDGRNETERFSDFGEYRKRLVALEQLCKIELPDRILVGQRGSETAKRTYSVGMRAFEIIFVATTAHDHLSGSWTVERVIETSRGGRELAVPGVYGIVAPTEDAALARACDCIDKWLVSTE